MRRSDQVSTIDATTTPIIDAEAWVAGFIEGWKTPRSATAFAAHFRSYLAPDVRLIQPQMPTIVGHRAFEAEFAEPLFALIPDLHGEIERWAASASNIYIELTLSGTLGGRPVRWRVCDRVTLRDGRAIERESYFDPSPLIRAIATRPCAWPAFLRLRARQLVNGLRRRASR
jgi:ketosteroid isomerase-like protein